MGHTANNSTLGVIRFEICDVNPSCPNSNPSRGTGPNLKAHDGGLAAWKGSLCLCRDPHHTRLLGVKSLVLNQIPEH